MENCGKFCKNLGGLQSHLHFLHKTGKIKKVKPMRSRKNRSYKFKANVLQQLYMARLSTTIDAEEKQDQTIAFKNGISKGMLSRWKREAFLYAAVDGDWNCRKQRAKSRSMYTRTGKFDCCNQSLYYKLCYNRRVLGFEIDNFWLRHQMIRLVKDAATDGVISLEDADKFKASNGWLSKFLKKYGVSSQVATEKKPLHVTARLPLIQSFHNTIMSIQRSQGKSESSNSVYGRFAPEAIWNTDQIPLNFEHDSNKSYNEKGKSCWIRKLNSGKSKRFCSLQLTLRASGEQLMPPVVLFKGQGPQKNRDGTFQKGHKKQKDELDAVEGVIWYFNPTGYANGESTRYHLRQFKGHVTKYAPSILEHMMLLDSLGSHKTHDSLEFASRLDIQSIFLPGGCTDLVQPVDKHIGAWFKQQLKQIWKKFFIDQFIKDPNFKVSDHQKRVLILQWVSEIWKKLKGSEYEGFIKETFEQPGILIKLDGTNKIKFEDYPQYKLDCQNIPEWLVE